MDLSLTRDNVRINEPVFEGSAEHPIDCEIILPDYCPDIARILKTESCVNIDSKAIENGRLTVNGELSVRIIYIPENSSNVRCVTHNEPFSHSFEIREDAENAYLKVKARTAFANCRPIGPRKVQIKASLSIMAKVWVTKEESFISDCEEDKIELLRKPVKVCTLIGSAEKQFKVSDDLEIGYGKPPAAAIIKSSATAVLQDCKVINNKIIAKGEAKIHTLYSCDDESGHIEMMEHTLPVSQIIDMDGVDETCMCDVHFITGDSIVDTESDSDGENRVLSVELNITADAKAYKEQEFFTINDAFCTDYDMELKTKPLNFEHINNMAKFNEMIRLAVDVPGSDISNVIDCSANPVVTGSKFEGKSLIVEGNMEISILAADSQNSPVSVEKVIPFTLKEELAGAGGAMRCDPEISVVSAECGMVGADSIDLRIECCLEAVIFSVVSDNVIVDMIVDDSKEKECPCRKTLTLYFADKGEKIWNIAKRYNTSMNAIMRENSLESDELDERSMLLIPKARCRKNDLI